MKLLRSPLAHVCLVVVIALATLFHRTWRSGEVFSPADVIFLFYPWTYDAPFTQATNTTRSDEAFFHQPLMDTHWRRLKAGDWPDLNPDVLAGAPAFFQGLDVGRAFSPLSLPFYLTSADTAVTLYAPLRLFAAALGMWVYLGSLGLGGSARLTGALAFGLNGAFLVWLSAPMPTVALFMPVTWWLVDKALGGAGRTRARPSDRSVGGLAVAIGAMTMGAYIPTTIACLVVLALYALVRVWMLNRWGRLVPLAGSAVLGLAIGAVALVPMFDNLLTSPVSERSMTQAYLPASNLATFLVPNFWGNPVLANWWYPGVGSYPEFVTYLGIATMLFAAAGGTWWWVRDRDARTFFFSALVLASLGMMYGWPPVTWLNTLPGFKQMSPLRWNAVLASVVAVLAAWGVEWIVGSARLGGGHQTTAAGTRDAGADAAPLSRNGPLSATPLPSRARWLPAGASTLAFLGLTATTAAISFWHLPLIRALSLQPFLRREIAWAIGTGAIAMLLVGVAALRRGAWRGLTLDAAARQRLGHALGTTCVALVAFDLIRWGMGFNPTLPPEKLYPSTPGIEFLQQQVSPHRFAPVGSAGELVNGHVWSVYGLASITGLDFHGDGPYQEFVAAAAGEPFTGAKWEYIGLHQPGTLDLKLLGLLDVEALVLSPRDVSTAVGGYLPFGELTENHLVRQPFEVQGAGFHRLDVLTGTFGRTNEGAVNFAIIDQQTGDTLASRRVPATELPDNDWLTLEFEPQPGSAQRRYILDVRGEGGAPGRAAMVWSAVAQANPLPPAIVNGSATDRVLWIRTFSAPPQLGEAPLLFARDLNIYRNPRRLPRAWFVRDATVAPREHHLDTLRAPSFEPADTALITQAPAHPPRTSGRVLSLDLSEPDARRISVEAPEGGLLMVSERWHRGWHATVDGVPTQPLRANGVLMCLSLPPGAHDVRLEFVYPLVRLSMLVSLLACALALALAFWPARALAETGTAP